MTSETRTAKPPGVVEPAREPARGVRQVCMFTAEAQKGHARYTHDLLEALAKVGSGRGYRFTLATGEDLADRYRSSLYEIETLLPALRDRRSFRTPIHWAASRAIHYFQREQGFLRWLSGRRDIGLVHFQEYTPWLAPRHYARLRNEGRAVVATVHNIQNFAHLNQSYARRMQAFWRSAWRTCSALFVHTDGLRDDLAAFLGPGHPPILVTPHAVWEERTGPPTPVAPPGPGETARLLFFGMLRPNKGLHVLVNAMEHLPECSLTVVGSSETDAYVQEVRALAGRLPAGRVQLIERFVDESEIAPYFDAAHLVVLPYTSFASQSGVLHQALAHGRPVVASDLGGMGRSIVEWGIGQVVPPYDPVKLAEGIRRALEAEAFRAAAQATLSVRGRLTWEAMAEATLDGYESVLA